MPAYRWFQTNLPSTEADNGNEHEDCKVLDALVGRFYLSGTLAMSRLPLVSRMRISRFCRYASSSTISLTVPSSLRISTSRIDRCSWLAIALTVSSAHGRDSLVVYRICANVHIEINGTDKPAGRSCAVSFHDSAVITRTTLIRVAHADTHIRAFVCSDRQPSLAIDVLVPSARHAITLGATDPLRQVHVAFVRSIKNLDIDTLVGTWRYVGRHDHERVRRRKVPDTERVSSTVSAQLILTILLRQHDRKGRLYSLGCGKRSATSSNLIAWTGLNSNSAPRRIAAHHCRTGIRGICNLVSTSLSPLFSLHSPCYPSTSRSIPSSTHGERDRHAGEDHPCMIT